MGTLPDGFEDLERFVPRWIHDSERARNRFRVEQSYTDLRDFYDATMPRLAEIARYLDGFPLDALPKREGNLLELALMTMEVAPAIEYYQSPDVPDSVAFEKFEIHSPKAPYHVVDEGSDA